MIDFCMTWLVEEKNVYDTLLLKKYPYLGQKYAWKVSLQC